MTKEEQEGVMILDETMVMIKAKDLQNIQDELKNYKNAISLLSDELKIVKKENIRLTDYARSLMASVLNWQEFDSRLFSMTQRVTEATEELGQELNAKSEKKS